MFGLRRASLRPARGSVSRMPRRAAAVTDAAEQRIAELKRLLLAYRGLGVDQHGDPAGCPHWYDGCHCLGVRLGELESENERVKLELAAVSEKYRWMVGRVADQKLDKYRAMGQRIADLEALNERLREELKSENDRLERTA